MAEGGGGTAIADDYLFSYSRDRTYQLLTIRGEYVYVTLFTCFPTTWETNENIAGQSHFAYLLNGVRDPRYP